MVRATLDDFGLIGWPKTSGSRGIHIYVRIEPRWTFTQVRRAALALAREVERRAPALATSKWWKEERHGVFLDYNQNAKDRTMAARLLGAAHRPTRACRRRSPGRSSNVADPADFTLATMPARFAALGDPHAAMDDAPVRARRAAGALGPAGAGRPRRRAVAAALREAGGRAAAGAAVEAPRTPSRPLIEIARAPTEDAALAGLERWKARHPAAAAHLQPADVLVDRMRGRSTTWTRIRINLEHVPEHERPQPEPLDPDDAPERLERGQRAIRRRAEDLRELVRRRDRELVVGAAGRCPVGAPAQEDGGVTEAVALHVVVFDLAHAFDAERLPRQILARAPSALAAGHARGPLAR